MESGRPSVGRDYPDGRQRHRIQNGRLAVGKTELAGGPVQPLHDLLDILPRHLDSGERRQDARHRLRSLQGLRDLRHGVPERCHFDERGREIMPKTVALTGNSACAEAMRQINPDVVAAYPITPQTTIVEEFSTFAAKGQVQTEYVTVESEHSAMSACVGASAAGSRVMTTTSSQGLALMWEILYIASALRLPIVMHNVNRTLSAPINIHCDHQDSMGARDSGWIQIFCEDAQEAYDTTIQAVRIAEDNRVRLPVMVCLDGFIISHPLDRLEMPDDDVVKKFVGDFEPMVSLLDPAKPVTVGPFDGLHGYFFEFRRAQELATLGSLPVIEEVGEEYGKISSRAYGLFEPY